jgi:hypothetical protein
VVECFFLADREAGTLDQIFMAGEGISYHDTPGRLSRIYYGISHSENRLRKAHILHLRIPQYGHIGALLIQNVSN